MKPTKINTLLKKGINTITTTNALNTTNNTIKEQEKKLLTPLVNDQDVLNILVQEENTKKIANRLIHEIHYKGNNDFEENIILATSTTGNKTLTQVINELQNTTKKIGTHIGSGLALNKKLARQGHYINMNNPKGGTIKTITIKTKIIKP